MYFHKIISRTIYLVPVWWILGFQFFIFHLSSLLSFALLLYRRQGKIKIPPFSILIILYTFSLITSLVLAYIRSEPTDLNRIASATYNITFWLMGFFIFIAIYNIRSYHSLIEVYLSLRFYPFFAGIGTLIGLIFWFLGLEEFSTRSLLGSLITSDTRNLLQASTHMTFLQPDWLAGSSFPRSSVLAVYPTALAASIIATLPAVYTSYKLKESTKIFFYSSLFLGIIALLLTWSRMSIAAFFFSFITIWFFTFKNRLLIITFSLLLLLAIWPFIYDLIQGIYMLREGSSTNRFANYIWGIKYVLNENPFFGLGIKPRVDMHNVPVGSHSMYIGSFIRGGFISLFLFSVWQICIISYILYRLRNSTLIFKSTSISIIAISLWMLTEDIDAPQFVCFIYFVLLGINFKYLNYNEK